MSPDTSASSSAAPRAAGRATRIGFISLGCPKNQLDCELMLARTVGAGYELTPDIAAAEAIVINTCCFIQPALDEADAAIREALTYKASGACRAIVVAGCLPQYLKDLAAQRYPAVDAWLTPDQPAQLPQVLGRLLSDSRPGGGEASASATGAPPGTGYRLPSFLASHADGRVLTTPPSLAYVKIAEGCDHRCRFCIIPQLRGRYRSRPVDDIAAEAEGLVVRGIPEIVLVSQDSSAYGLDLDDGSSLAALLERLCAIPGPFWLRVLYLYPTRVTPALLRTWARLGPKLLPYFDIPLQHVSAAVLKAMGRGGGRERHDRLLRMIRRACPQAVIRTTLIAGFPGETEEDFAELLTWVQSGAVDRLGVFAYSELPEMRSAGLPGKLSAQTKQQRVEQLMLAQQEVVGRQATALLDCQYEVVIEEVARSQGGWEARGRSWREAYEIDGQVVLNFRRRPRLYSRVAARIVGVRGYDLLARPAAGGAAR